MAYCTVTVPLTAGASVTGKSSVWSSPSVACVSATDSRAAKAICCATAFDSFLPSDVQIAPVSVQFSVSPRESSTVPVPDGVTVRFHTVSLPAASAAAVTVAPDALTALRIWSAVADTASLNSTWKSNAVPLCDAGTSSNSTVSGSPLT